MMNNDKLEIGKKEKAKLSFNSSNQKISLQFKSKSFNIPQKWHPDVDGEIGSGRDSNVQGLEQLQVSDKREWQTKILS